MIIFAQIKYFPDLRELALIDYESTLWDFMREGGFHFPEEYTSELC